MRERGRREERREENIRREEIWKRREEGLTVDWATIDTGIRSHFGSSAEVDPIPADTWISRIAMDPSFEPKRQKISDDEIKAMAEKLTQQEFDTARPEVEVCFREILKRAVEAATVAVEKIVEVEKIVYIEVEKIVEVEQIVYIEVEKIPCDQCQCLRQCQCLWTGLCLWPVLSLHQSCRLGHYY